MAQDKYPFAQEWGSMKQFPPSQPHVEFKDTADQYPPGSWQSSTWPEAEDPLLMRVPHVMSSNQLVSRSTGAGAGAGLQQLQRAMKLLKTSVHSSTILRHSEIPTTTAYPGGEESLRGSMKQRSVLSGQEDLHTALHKIEIELRDCSKSMLDFCVETEADMHMLVAM